MPLTLGVVMDPISGIKPYKDSTFAMLLAAQARGWAIRYFEPADLYVRDGVARGRCLGLTAPCPSVPMGRGRPGTTVARS